MKLRSNVTALAAMILSLIPAAVSAQAGSWVLPSSAFRGGTNGAEFRTDARILNKGTSRVTVTSALYDQTSAAAFASVINNASGDPFALVAIGMPPTGPLAFPDGGLDLGSGAGRCVALGDVDADGDVDALVSIGDAPSMFWKNDGNGRFVSSGHHLGRNQER
jgi:hypothetical protein